MSESVRFHLDPRCPWCWQTSRWVRQLNGLGVIDVSWGVFCLEVQNFTKSMELFDPDRSIAAASLRTLVAVRDAEPSDDGSTGQRAAGRFYEALGLRYFDLEQPLDQPATIEGALADAGLDRLWHQRALADPSTWQTVLDEQAELCADTRSFGVPTIRLDGGHGPAIFGPVISNPPGSDADAVALWEHVSWLVRYENFSELKRDRTIDPDLAQFRTARARAAERSS